jgi:hypothetical protein
VRVIRHARCANGRLDPDQWFPVSAEADKARQEAAVAIAICTTCLVRDPCLALSLRHWDIGQHGVWGGLLPAERAALRRRTHAGLSHKALGNLSLMAWMLTRPAFLRSEDAEN